MMKLIVTCLMLCAISGWSAGYGIAQNRGVTVISHEQIAADLKGILSKSYPNIQITVKPWDQDPSRTAVYFVDERFSGLYPQQRAHYVYHAIPHAYYETHLQDTVWYELTPGEDPSELEYPDDELIVMIKENVMKVVARSGFYAALDDIMSPADPALQGEPCHGDFRHAKAALAQTGFSEDEYFDVLHVFMDQGGFCDCEILYNVSEENRLKTKYWQQRAKTVEKGGERRTHE